MSTREAIQRARELADTPEVFGDGENWHIVPALLDVAEAAASLPLKTRPGCDPECRICRLSAALSVFTEAMQEGDSK